MYYIAFLDKILGNLKEAGYMSVTASPLGQVTPAEEHAIKVHEALRQLVLTLGEHHVEMVSNCTLWGARQGLVEDLHKRYWNDPALVALLPDEVEQTKAQLAAFPLKPPIAS